MEFYEKAAEYLQLLKDNINRCDKTIKKAPPGILRAKKRGQHFEYYCLKNKKETYLNKSNESLIISLGASTYAQNYKKYALNEIEAIQAYLSKRNKNILGPENYLRKYPGISKVVSHLIYKGPADLEAWAKEKYNQSDFYASKLTIKTAQGHYVRSKSECVIADALYMNGIAYRYEPKLYINGRLFRPDFEIYTKDGRHIIWEHLGIMDNEEYRRKAFEKIEQYILAGFVIGVDLIITMDGLGGRAIDSNYIHDLINFKLK